MCKNVSSTNTVVRTEFKQFRSTPLLISISTVSTSLFWQAKCKGVFPCCKPISGDGWLLNIDHTYLKYTLVCLLSAAPWWIIESNIPLQPWLAATWSGVKPIYKKNDRVRSLISKMITKLKRYLLRRLIQCSPRLSIAIEL